MPDPTPAGHVHVESHRIVMSEVDVAQIHFTTFFRWMDRSFCEWLADVGRPFTRLLEEGPGIPVVDAQCRYVARVRLDDLVTIRTHVAEAGRTSFRVRHEFRRGAELVGEGVLVHVCVERASRRTLPVPDWLRAHVRPDAG
ncbi:MAG: acyl-CoA thioester hydrolase [Miltoncostaeaceae bacterium]|jgi:acyl-CoA thioester hydrolase|nr:acyl-CoA thioester hydrolase [Miltoncostaeaceae bacterium]